MRAQLHTTEAVLSSTSNVDPQGLPNPALSIAEAAKYAGLAAGTLRNRISQGTGPEVVRTGRKVMVRLQALERWMNSDAYRNGGGR